MCIRISAAAAIAALAVLGVAGSAAASNSAFWTDPVGDSANAPDLTRITLSNDDAGKITFTITYGNRPAGLNQQDQVQIWINADMNPSTGDENGSDTRADNSRDDAPDAQDKVFVYSLTAARPTRVLVAFNPKPPKAGKRVVATVVLVTLDDGNSTIPISMPITCTATLKGKPIPTTAIPMGCAWKLPKSAKGKPLVVTITVSNNGSKGTFGPWRFKVR